MSDKKHSRVGVVVAIAMSVLVFGFAGWLFLNRQYAMDQVSVWAYDAPASVKVIEERVGFSNKGAFYFRATQPEVAEAETFNQDCPRQEPGSPILGCYNEGRIYIYDISNDQLDGIEEVTAAHEMLHAVWERMSSSEQQRVGSLLRAAYGKLADPDLKERMDYYARTEPGEFENELHSIIGTEVPTVGSELEQYYAQYFTDRQKILELHAKYDTVFKSFYARSEALYAELNALAKSVESRTTQYNTDIAQLSADIDAFNARANNGGFTSAAQFNSERAALVARSNQLESDRDVINAEISSYNTKYEEYQSLSVQIEALNSSIDSIQGLDPAPSL